MVVQEIVDVGMPFVYNSCQYKSLKSVLCGIIKVFDTRDKFGPKGENCEKVDLGPRGHIGDVRGHIGDVKPSRPIHAKGDTGSKGPKVDKSDVDKAGEGGPKGENGDVREKKRKGDRGIQGKAKNLNCILHEDNHSFSS